MACTLVSLAGVPADIFYLATFYTGKVDLENKWVQALGFDYPIALGSLLTAAEVILGGVMLTSNYYGGELETSLAYLGSYFILFSLPLIPAWAQLLPAINYGKFLA